MVVVVVVDLKNELGSCMMPTRSFSCSTYDIETVFAPSACRAHSNTVTRTVILGRTVRCRCYVIIITIYNTCKIATPLGSSSHNVRLPTKYPLPVITVG